MKNTFEAAYEQEMRNEAAYDAAKAAGDEAGIEKARETYAALMEKIESKGEAYCRIYREYVTARNRGNDLLDLNDTIWDRQVEGLVACMKENGIDRFTFSSTWSDSVGTAWLFKENGCRLEGLVQINGMKDSFRDNEYKRVPAYLFSLS